VLPIRGWPPVVALQLTALRRTQNTMQELPLMNYVGSSAEITLAGSSFGIPSPIDVLLPETAVIQERRFNPLKAAAL
jgi:hypothetical protein